MNDRQPLNYGWSIALFLFWPILFAFILCVVLFAITFVIIFGIVIWPFILTGRIIKSGNTYRISPLEWS